MTFGDGIRDVTQLFIQQIPSLNSINEHYTTMTALKDMLIHGLRHVTFRRGEIAAIEYSSDFIYQNNGFIRQFANLLGIDKLNNLSILGKPGKRKICQHSDITIFAAQVIDVSNRAYGLTAAELTLKKVQPPTVEITPRFILDELAEK